MALVRYLFTLDDVHSFLSQRICQDPLENFFGRQRQRGGNHDNPSVKEFMHNTQALRVAKTFKIHKGNCRKGTEEDEEMSVKENSQPIPKRARCKASKPIGLN